MNLIDDTHTQNDIRDAIAETLLWMHHIFYAVYFVIELLVVGFLVKFKWNYILKLIALLLKKNF